MGSLKFHNVGYDAYREIKNEVEAFCNGERKTVKNLTNK